MAQFYRNRAPSFNTLFAAFRIPAFARICQNQDLRDYRIIRILLGARVRERQALVHIRRRERGFGEPKS